MLPSFWSAEELLDQAFSPKNIKKQVDIKESKTWTKSSWVVCCTFRGIVYSIIRVWKKVHSIFPLYTGGTRAWRYSWYFLERDSSMNWQEAEQLAECIRTETAGLIVVLGIEHLGPAGNPLYATEFFVKCACKRT